MSAKRVGISIHLDLLKPQSSPEVITKKLTRWLFSSGRFIFIIVEAVVLIAFLSRFFLDNSIATKKKEIEQLVPYIQSLKPYEVAIRNLQLKLTHLNKFFEERVDYAMLLTAVSSDTPLGVQFSSLSFKNAKDSIEVQIAAKAKNNNDLLAFLTALKQDTNFTNVTLSNIGLEGNVITFTIGANAVSTRKK